MTTDDLVAVTNASTAGPKATVAGPQATTVVWRTIIVVELNPTRRLRRQFDAARAGNDLDDRLRRMDCARQVLEEIEDSSAEGNWRITLGSRVLRAERWGGSFAELEHRLLDRGLRHSDFTVRVEYSRAWGML